MNHSAGDGCRRAMSQFLLCFGVVGGKRVAGESAFGFFLHWRLSNGLVSFSIPVRVRNRLAHTSDGNVRHSRDLVGYCSGARLRLETLIIFPWHANVAL